MNNWSRGLNFSRAKYKIRKNIFIPHVRSDYNASIPRSIIEKFDPEQIRDLVALLEIEENKRKVLRIKKLVKKSNSFVISLKAEKKFRNPKIKILDLKNEGYILARPKEINKNKIDLRSIIPTHTNKNIKSTPIYLFQHREKIIIGGYYKKDLIANENIILDENSLSAVGLYFCDGGKVNASFTNSYPDAINAVLGFLEENFYIDRESVRAAIYCNENLALKKHNLEEFWSQKTRISNFYEKLHLSKNSTSPCGTLELHFSSKILKEIFVSIIENLFRYEFDRTAVMRGVLSGDGSPIKQTKYNLTHHIASDKKPESLDFIRRVFSGYVIKVIPSQPKITIYTNWNQNKILLLKDPYKFNLVNRVKFSHRFLSLPKTLKSENRELEKFKKRNYPDILNCLIQHYKDLVLLELAVENSLERIKNEFNLR